MKQWKKTLAVVLSFVMVITGLQVSPDVAKAADAPTLYGDTVTVNAGNEISVTLKVKGNSGVMGFGLNIGFDKDVLTPIDDVKASSLLAGQFVNSVEQTLAEGTESFKVIWAGTENMSENGELFTMKFKVADNATGSTQITTTVSQEDTFDADFNDVMFTCEPVEVSINGTTTPEQPNVTAKPTETPVIPNEPEKTTEPQSSPITPNNPDVPLGEVTEVTSIQLTQSQLTEWVTDGSYGTTVIQSDGSVYFSSQPSATGVPGSVYDNGVAFYLSNSKTAVDVSGYKYVAITVDTDADMCMTTWQGSMEPSSYWDKWSTWGGVYATSTNADGTTTLYYEIDMIFKNPSQAKAIGFSLFSSDGVDGTTFVAKEAVLKDISFIAVAGGGSSVMPPDVTGSPNYPTVTGAPNPTQTQTPGTSGGVNSSTNNNTSSSNSKKNNTVSPSSTNYNTSYWMTKPAKVKIKKVKKAGKKKLKVTWKWLLEADGFQIQYAQNKKFTKKKKTKNVSDWKTDQTLKGLKSKKTYYVRIRAYKKYLGSKVYGSWSKVKKCKVK